MLHVGRPLTLLVLAVCTYVFLTWSYSSTTRLSTKPDYIYDENGYRIPATAVDQQEPLHTTPPPVKEKGQEVVVTTSRHASRPAMATAGSNSSDRMTKVITKPAKTYTATSDLPLPTLSPGQQRAYMQDMLHWNRPNHVDGHWPDYEAFQNEDYDPNRWEGFEMYVLRHGRVRKCYSG
jgi:hypothetical protein